MYRRLLLVVLTLLYIYGNVKSQENKPDRDSLRIARDSLKVARDSFLITRDSMNFIHDSLDVTKDTATFRAIEKYSEKSKIGSFIHHLIFKTAAGKSNSADNKGKIKRTKLNRKAEGKIIRQIYIVTQDPFGYDLQDTSVHPKQFILKAGNGLHVKTRPMIIRNLLLFKKNQVYDSLLVNESVRLIRSQNYVRDVILYSVPASRKNDSVDVYITVSDVWSIGGSLSYSRSNKHLTLSDVNFAGLGSKFTGEVMSNRNPNYKFSRISYLVPNIHNSYISLNIQSEFPGSFDMIKNFDFTRAYYPPESSNLKYLFSTNKDLVRSIEIQRLFYSPFTKWAGGIFLGQMIMAQSYTQQDTIRYLAELTNVQDYWVARSWQLFRWNTPDGRITSIILSGRMVRISYPGRSAEAETANLFNNEKIYFAGIGVTSRRYIKDRYIYNYGKIEDFPVGRDFGLTLGIDVLHTNRIYMGLKAGWGDYYHFGYLSTHIEYGTFKGSDGFQQGAFTVRINYFTRLLTYGNWKLRHFIRPTIILGINRLPSDNLSFGDVMKGFENLNYPATQMIVLNLQTQSYSPWKLIGFHFGPFIFTSLGMLGNETSGFGDSRLYSSFGAGILIKNNYLTFNTIQISFTYYPFSPGSGYNYLRTNAYKTNDYGFTDFEISKPSIVEYR